MLLASCCPLSMKPDEVSAFSIFVSDTGICFSPMKTCQGQEDYLKPLTVDLKPHHQKGLPDFFTAASTYFSTFSNLLLLILFHNLPKLPNNSSHHLDSLTLEMPRTEAVAISIVCSVNKTTAVFLKLETRARTGSASAGFLGH